MDLIAQIRDKARQAGRHIVLAEGTEQRTLIAAAAIVAAGIARITLLGREAEIKAAAEQAQVDLDGITLIDPETSPLYADFTAEFLRLREKKGMTADKAAATMKNPLYFGAMMVYQGVCQGMVAGAENSTGDVLRPALQIIKTRPGVSIVSGSFLIISPKTEYGEGGVMIFADCAVNPELNAAQMAEVAYCSALTAQHIAGIEEPRVAFLSFSTKGSAKNELAETVAEAAKIARERYPDLLSDGELQLDAAIVPNVGALKAPGSPVAGRANVLIFPDLTSGNICYKAVQRFGGAQAIGPILQGMAKPVNDLSRGCSVEDIINTVALVCCQGADCGC
ncbi:MAG: phosphate acetyltransferase [Clostridia bacterium]|nr:phosphate acetyltransferase [Clostridia bacterium]